MSTNQNLRPNVLNEESALSIVIKSVVIFVLFGFIALFVLGYAIATIERFGDNTPAVLEWCERYYNEMDYESLKLELDLYGKNDERLDKYYEYVRGYELYIECIQWIECELEGVDNAGSVLNDKLSELKELAKNTKFSTSKIVYEEYIEGVEKMRLNKNDKN